jgi:hypothetical protein
MYSELPPSPLSPHGAVPSRALMNPAEAPRILLMRAGETGSFIFTVVAGQHPEARMTVRFTDDADLHWQINHDLHLEPLDNRNDR